MLKIESRLALVTEATVVVTAGNVVVEVMVDVSVMRTRGVVVE